MSKVLLHLSTISVRIINFDGAKENLLDKCLYQLYSVMAVWLNEWILASVLYYALFKAIYLDRTRR